MANTPTSDGNSNGMVRLEYQRLGALPRPPRRLGPWGISLCLWVPLLVLRYDFLRVYNTLVDRCIGGRVVPWSDGNYSGMTVTPYTIRNHFWGFLIIFAVIFLYVTALRYLSDRVSRSGYWAFAVPMTIISLYLLALWTIPCWWLITYVRDMGFTSQRVQGLSFGAGGYLGLLVFTCWAIWPGRRWPHRRQRDS